MRLKARAGGPVSQAPETQLIQGDAALSSPIGRAGSGSIRPDTAIAPRETGALIVGGGPAGLAAAIALRQRGIDCTVVEARTPGIDKACGEGLMPDALQSLAELGVPISEADGHPFRGIRFADPLHRVDARFPQGFGIGVRRTRLHTLLAHRAEQTGVRVLWNSHIHLPLYTAGITPRPEATDLHAAMVNGRPIRFRWLIGADGQASQIRRWAGLDRVRTQSLRYGFRTHYRVAPWSEFVEVHWARGGQLYVTPVAPNCLCIVYITRDPRCDRTAIIEQFPEVARRLCRASPEPEPVSQQRGAVSATCKLRSVANQFVALIGDASGSADAITGEGLAMSFRQAHALADSIASGSLVPYRRAHPRIARLPHAMSTLMLTLDHWPAIAAPALRSLAVNPAIFQDLLSAHVGERSLPGVLLRRAPRFGWTLLRNEVGAWA
jgi:2-polyprenyl-6-methoxyphenol hydroxylase-like FAD-dependent oxidoreductase